jgi:hypothetical protein
MPQRVPSLQLPLPRSEAARETNRQLIVWAGRMVSVLNSLSADPGLKNSGNPGSAVTTLPFSGSGAAIDISGLMHFVEGGVSLATIKPPQGFSGMFFMIAASSFALVAGGNIVVPGQRRIADRRDGPNGVRRKNLVCERADCVEPAQHQNNHIR